MSWSSRSTPPSPTTSRRAYNIAHRKQWVARALIATFFVALVVRYYRSSSNDCRLHMCAVRMAL